MAHKQDNNKKKEDYRVIYEMAYEAMNTSVLPYDCGKLCSHNCCRNDYENPEEFGVYLLPYEYEHFLKYTDAIKPNQLVRHTAKDRFIPKSVKGLNYFLCDSEKDCLRYYRPIQCRTYPLEPHLERDVLYLVVERDQIHSCPLIEMKSKWQPEYVRGIYRGWTQLMQIPEVRKLVLFDSDLRRREENVLYRLTGEECENFENIIEK